MRAPAVGLQPRYESLSNCVMVLGRKPNEWYADKLRHVFLHTHTDDGMLLLGGAAPAVDPTAVRRLGGGLYGMHGVPAVKPPSSGVVRTDAWLLRTNCQDPDYGAPGAVPPPGACCRTTNSQPTNQPTCKPPLRVSTVWAKTVIGPNCSHTAPQV
jgi:hypothetical protein